MDCGGVDFEAECDDAESCSEPISACEYYEEFCMCCASGADPLAGLTCITDADCALNEFGATSCGTPMMNGAVIEGTFPYCIDPMLCNIDATVGDVTSTISCGASTLMVYVAGAMISVYMAI